MTTIGRNKMIKRLISGLLSIAMVAGVFGLDLPFAFAGEADADITVTMQVNNGEIAVSAANSAKLIGWDESRAELKVAAGAQVKLVQQGADSGEWVKEGSDAAVETATYYYPETQGNSKSSYYFEPDEEALSRTSLLNIAVEHSERSNIDRTTALREGETTASGTQEYGSFNMEGLNYAPYEASANKNVMYVEWYLADGNAPLNDQNKVIAAGQFGTDLTKAGYTSNLVYREQVSNIASGSGRKMQFAALAAEGYAIVGMSDGYSSGNGNGKNHRLQYRDTLHIDPDGTVNVQCIVYGGTNGYPVIRVFLQKTLESDPAAQTLIKSSDVTGETLRLVPDWARSAEKTMAGYQYYKKRSNDPLGDRSMLMDFPKEYSLNNSTSWLDGVLPLVYAEHNNKADVFDVGSHTSIYGKGGRDWASFVHPFTNVTSGGTLFPETPTEIRESNEMISMRRFSSTVHLGDVEWSHYDYVGLVSRLGAENVPINDGLLVYINGEYAWGGGHGMKLAKENLPIGNLAESVRRTNMKQYQNTDYWYIDIMEDSDMTNLKSMLQAASAQNGGKVQIDIIALENNNAGGIYAYDLLFSGKPVEFTVVKEDTVKNKLLSGASFQLYSQIEQSGNGYNTDYLVKDTANTGNNGQLNTPWKILPGDYYLVETKAPNGYQKMSEPIHVAIGQNQDGPYVEVLDDTEAVVAGITNDGTLAFFVNNHSLESIKIKKVGDGGENLAGAEFTVYKVENDGSITDKSVGNVLTTGANGQVTSGKSFLLNQVYCLRETKVPDGYESKGDVFFKIVYDQSAKKVKTLLTDAMGNALADGYDFANVNANNLITVRNDRIYASIKVTKTIDEMDARLGNPTFFFRLEGSDGSVYYRQVTFTEQDALAAGKTVVFDHLPAGIEYTLTEEQPMRYQYDSVAATNETGMDNATGTVQFKPMTDLENYYTAVYHNKLVNDTYFSDADIVTNHVVAP